MRIRRKTRETHRHERATVLQELGTPTADGVRSDIAVNKARADKLRRDVALRKGKCPDCNLTDGHNGSCYINS